MKERLKKALSGLEAFVEVRIQRKSSNRVSYRKAGVDKIVSTNDAGGFVRALAPNCGWGVVTFNSMDEIEKSIEEAIKASSSVVPDEPVVLAKTEAVDAFSSIPMKDDPKSHSITEKIELAEHYNNLIKDFHPSVMDTMIIYGDAFSETTYANSEGSYLVTERADILLVANVVTREGQNVQTANKSWSSRDDFGFVKNREDEIKKIAQQAVDLLSADSVKGGIYTVVLNQNLSGVFIHEAFGHLSEADFITENPQAQEMMKLGRRFGPDILNVRDGGTVEPALRGSIEYDDEAVPAGNNYLIKNGILVGRLHSRESAGKLSEKPTGNARAQDYGSVPLVRMTNTYIENGETSFDDMIKDIELVCLCA
jgi:TldD protein